MGVETLLARHLSLDTLLGKNRHGGLVRAGRTAVVRGQWPGVRGQWPVASGQRLETVGGSGDTVG